MKFKSSLLLGMLVFGVTSGLGVSAQATPIDIVVPTPDTPAPPATSTPAPAPDTSLPPVDLNLNANQREAITEITEFAFDQFDAIIGSGLNPEKLDRAEMKRRAGQIGDRLRTIRPDAAQLEQLRAILRTARDQMERQIKTGTPTR